MFHKVLAASKTGKMITIITGFSCINFKSNGLV